MTPTDRERGATLTVWVLSCVMLAACERQHAAPSQQHAESTPPAIRYEAHLEAGDLAPAGGALQNPHAGEAAAANRGQQLFTAMNCDGCHGGAGAGWVGPRLSDGRWRYGGADDEIFNSIYYGRPRGMPAFGGALGPEGVWALVTYIKSLPVPPQIATESWEKP